MVFAGVSRGSFSFSGPLFQLIQSRLARSKKAAQGVVEAILLSQRLFLFNSPRLIKRTKSYPGLSQAKKPIASKLDRRSVNKVREKTCWGTRMKKHRQSTDRPPKAVWEPKTAPGALSALNQHHGPQPSWSRPFTPENTSATSITSTGVTTEKGEALNCCLTPVLVDTSRGLVIVVNMSIRAGPLKGPL